MSSKGSSSSKKEKSTGDNKHESVECGPGKKQATPRLEHTSESTVSTITTIYKNHMNMIVERLRSIYGNGPPEPEDAVQSAFDALITRDDVSDITNIKGYLFHTARNTLLSAIRRKSVAEAHKNSEQHHFIANFSDTSDPERVLLAREQIRLIQHVLNKMPYKRRQAFVLNRREGMNVTQVAKHLQVSRATVIEHIANAMNDINQHLRQCGNPLVARGKRIAENDE